MFSSVCDIVQINYLYTAHFSGGRVASTLKNLSYFSSPSLNGASYFQEREFFLNYHWQPLVCLHSIRLIWKQVERPDMADVSCLHRGKALTLCPEMYR